MIHAFPRSWRLTVLVINPTLNILLNSATLPRCWKKAKLIPLLRKLSAGRSVLANFRPISLLPDFSKVPEKWVNRLLSEYLEQHQLLRLSQSGFRPGFSMELALMEVLDIIKLAVDEGKKVALLLLNLSAAFVSHPVLLQHLGNIGAVVPLWPGSNHSCWTIAKQSGW